MAFYGEPEDLILLEANASYQDEEGGYHEGKREPHPVVCRSVIYGAMVRSQLRSSDIRLQNQSDMPYVGMTVMAVVELWTIDYSGETQAIFRGQEVEVEVDTVFGKKTQLILRQRLSNVTEDNEDGDDGP